MSKQKSIPTRVSAFGKDQLVDYWNRIDYHYQLFQKDRGNHHEAEAFAILAWQLYHDWLEILLPNDHTVIKGYADTQIQLELNILRDIADGLKHILLDRNHKVLKDQTITYVNVFDYTFDFTFGAEAYSA
ncbi:hypothetical protein [Chryseolinea soli]|uniref:Uncharacterized protein n=1 Tax=Chryseolinea soli TaxID=2321403 RepID=A0A385SPW2_9BACT|nr:hypothetical protein [Chryseolinea soli]AYB33044.1 hypothetical protein D4L85_21775 [Chryseolinea soli]